MSWLRSTRVWLPVVVGHAVAQAALVWPAVTPGWTIGFVALAVTSTVAALGAYAALCSAGTEGHLSGSATWSGTLARLEDRLGPTAAAAGVLLVVCVGALAVHVVLFAVAVALTVYVVPAALRGGDGPLAAARLIVRRPVRWVVGVLLAGVLAGVLWLLSAAAVFFVPGPVSTAAAWLVIGLLAAAMAFYWSATDAVRTA